MKSRPSIARLHEVLRYDAGRLYWIKRPDPMACRAVVGQEAGRSAAGGYNDIQLDHCRMKAHHIVWALCHGEYPANFIDHINGDKTDNRIENLRLATGHDNAANKASAKGATSAYLGVSFKTASKAWVAQISKLGKKIHLGLFDNELDAARAYNAAAIQLHGQFARLNQIDGSAA